MTCTHIRQLCGCIGGECAVTTDRFWHSLRGAEGLVSGLIGLRLPRCAIFKVRNLNFEKDKGYW